MVTIQQGSNQSGQNTVSRALDFGLIFCASLVLLFGILALDAYEYVSVPGASHARGKLVSMTEAFAIMDDMDEKERAVLDEEIKEAKNIVEEAKKEIVEFVEDENKETTDADEQEEDRSSSLQEEVNKSSETISDASSSSTKEPEVQSLLEKELGLDNFCGECPWRMGFNCDKRVSYLMQRYKITKIEAQEAMIKDCTAPGRVLRGARI